MAVIWFALAAALLVAEVLTLTLFLGVLALAAAAAGTAALLDAPLLAQLVVFGVSGTAFTAATQPLAKRRKELPAPRTGVAALPGKTAVVTAEVSATGGRVQLRGESWSARPLDRTRTFTPGTPVVVAEVDGATLVVYSEDL